MVKERNEVKKLVSQITFTTPLLAPLKGVKVKFGKVSFMLQVVFELILNVFSPPAAGKRRLIGLNVIVAVAPLCETGIVTGVTPAPVIDRYVFLANAEGFAVQVTVIVALFEPVATLEVR
jgi:hypothetical protein